MKTRFFPLFALCGMVASYGLVARAIEANPTQPADTGAVPASAAPPFSGRINDVVSLAKSGVDQSIVLAFIKNSPGPFEPSADEIIKLRDMGISTPELTAMLERGSELRDQAHAAAVAAAPAAEANPAEAPVMTETPPNTYAGSDTTQPASTVTYIGGDSGYVYPSTVWVSGWYPTAFFYPFPCWFGGVFFAHGCFFPHGCFVHDNFHVHDGSHSGFHGSSSGFHGSTSAGFHGNTSGFHGSTSGFHAGATTGFHGGMATAGGFHSGAVTSGGFHSGVSGVHTAPMSGGFRGGMVGGFHGSMGGGGGVHMGGGGGGGFHGGGGGGMHR